jgi:hypothetical protein
MKALSRWYRERVEWYRQREQQITHIKIPYIVRLLGLRKDTPTTFAELTPEELKRAKSMKAREGRVDKLNK